MREETDQAFAAGRATAFANGTLPAESMNHHLHVRLTWHYLNRWPLLIALQRMAEDTRQFTEVNGATGKYHETITCAWVLLVHERMQRDAAIDQEAEPGWDTFAKRHPDLFSSDSPILGRYYRSETLASDVARAQFVLPDRGISAPTRARASL